MTKKKSTSPENATIVLTITLPREGGLLRTATITARCGQRATVGSFDYTNRGDIADAIARTVGDLERAMQMQLKAPNMKDAEEYKPSLDAKRKEMLPGVTVKPVDSDCYGEIVAEANEGGHVLVRLDEREIPVFYRLEDLVQKARPTTGEQAANPIEIEGGTEADNAPVHSVPVAQDSSEIQQLAMF